MDVVLEGIAADASWPPKVRANARIGAKHVRALRKPVPPPSITQYARAQSPPISMVTACMFIVRNLVAVHPRMLRWQIQASTVLARAESAVAEGVTNDLALEALAEMPQLARGPDTLEDVLRPVVELRAAVCKHIVTGDLAVLFVNPVHQVFVRVRDGALHVTQTSRGADMLSVVTHWTVVSSYIRVKH